MFSFNQFLNYEVGMNYGIKCTLCFQQLVGGKKPENVNDPHVQEIAQYAVSQLNTRSNSPNLQKLVQVKDAQVQVSDRRTQVIFLYKLSIVNSYVTPDTFLKYWCL